MKHNLLTLITDKYTYLTPPNIKNINRLTGINKISFIDTDVSTKTNKYQYNNWDEIDDMFDYFIMVNCPFGIEHTNKVNLKPNGKIINLQIVNGIYPVEEPYVPFIIPPYDPARHHYFGPSSYCLDIYDNETSLTTKKCVAVDTTMIPIMDGIGRVFLPTF
jgi:hypothetical protein